MVRSKVVPTQTIQDLVATSPPPAARRAKKTKKPVQIVANITPDGIEGSFQTPEPRRSLITHLDVHSCEVQFSETCFQYNPEPPVQPDPYDGEEEDPFANYTRSTFEGVPDVRNTETIEELSKPKPIHTPLGTTTVAAATPAAEVSLQPFYKCDLMVTFQDTNDAKTLPDTVTIACFWCTEEFGHQPCILPEREEKGVYRVYGNFCSAECALAFLLHENLDSHVRWERMALLHRFYHERYPSRIFPAPARESLKKFGGPMTITQFRNTISAKKVRVDIQIPPLVSILGTMDTKPIDFFDTHVKGSDFAADILSEQTSKAKEGLRLRRTKPLKDKESTLDACMGITLRSTVGGALKN